jgi:hypothetical protein
MNPLTLNTVAPIPSDTNPTVVKLVGRNFIAGLAANWTPPGASQQVIPNSDIKFVDENHLEVSLVPGTTAGTGTLNLITPLNLEANATITITKT